MPTLQGTISDIGFKFTAKGNEFAEVSVSQTGKQYPVKARCFDEDLVARFKKAKKGMGVTLDIEEEPGEYQGKKITYRNIIGILDAQATPADAPQSAQTPQPSANGGSPAYVSDRERQQSIQRQGALRRAVELAAQGVLIPEGEQSITDAVLAAATAFAEWLDGTPEAEEGEQDASV
jgi:hypothetical protein